MWQNLLSMNDSKNKVVATFTNDIKLEQRLTSSGISEALAALSAGDFYLLTEELERFVKLANDRDEKACAGIIVAEKRNASLTIRISEDQMLAHMAIIGAYGGRGLRGSELIHVLAQEHVTKGINKLALKKVLQISQTLKPGEEYIQAVAQGKKPIAGRNGRLRPLVPDVTKQILAPSSSEDNSAKVDMRDLGETISVEAKTPVLRRDPPTNGVAGFTVQGKEILSIVGKDLPLKLGKGTEVDPNNPNILLASISGMPLIKDGTVHIENALCMKSIGVKTGHVKFKGCLVITGNIEAGMVVRATGSITVGGFIESADVQAQGDIFVKKGIIGRTVSEGERKSCIVKSGGSIKANYAQYAALQSHDDIHLAMHSLSNDIRCGANLTVLDSRISHGTLSGGNAKVGGKVLCYNLGVEGDTPTYIECFACYSPLKVRLEQLREKYLLAQDKTMELVRKELEFRKQPKSERKENVQREIEEKKQLANTEMIAVKDALEAASSDLEDRLTQCTIEVKKHVYTHVTVRFGDEKILTKKEHGSSVFSFNQYEISCKSSMLEEDVGSD
jgi:uncharacterized protein (DUF342 family)